MPFTELTFELGNLAAEAAEEACFACGASSVTFSDARDDPVLEPLPGELRLWPQTRVHALFAADIEPQGLVATLSSALGITPGQLQATPVPDRAWEREWLKDFHAMRFGRRLWICPHHERVDEPEAVIIRLDPGLAFGTGTHPTTALCLEWLDQNLEPGTRVIDYGCGSGILGIAAVKLGASAAECHDIDPQALIATRDNAAANGVAGQVRVVDSPDSLHAEADVLVANILSGPLCALATRFASLVRPTGALVLAGLMDHEAPEVARAASAWFDMRPFAERDGWVGLSGRRRS